MKKFSRSISFILSIAMIVAVFPFGAGISIAAVDSLAEDTTKVVNLTVNYQVDPIGIDKDQVRFSWQMKSDVIGQYQKNYQITVKDPDGAVVWDSGVVSSGLSTGVSYDYEKGAALQLETRYSWSVKVTDKAGEILTSEPAYFEGGADWTGIQWVYPTKSADDNANRLSGNTFDVSTAEAGTLLESLFGFQPATTTGAGSVSLSNYVRQGGNPLVRTEVPLNRTDIASARLYMAGLGNYEAYINGEKVMMADTRGGEMDPIFAPGWTDHRYYTNYQTYDVTDYIDGGKVVLGAEMNKGAYAGRVGNSSSMNTVLGTAYSSTSASRTMALSAKLVISYENGDTQVVSIKPDKWKSIAGPIVFNDYYNGELYNANRAKELDGWNDVGFDDSGWYAMPTIEDSAYPVASRLRPNNSAVARVAEEYTLAPQHSYRFKPAENYTQAEARTALNDPTFPNTRGAVKKYAVDEDLEGPVTIEAGEILAIDLGQNMVGVLELELSGAKDTFVRVRHSEMVCDRSGTSDAALGYLYYGAMRGADGQTSYYKLNDESRQTWRPKSTYNGFQYVEISVPVNGQSVTIHSIKGKVFSSTFYETGSIETSDWRVNKLIRNSFWGQMGNFMTIPTDCPQRTERTGWTGDIQLFTKTAITNFDSIPFLDAYQIICDANALNNSNNYGVVMPVGFNSGYATQLSSGWSDVGVCLPWQLYQQTGDEQYIRRAIEQMDRYMDRVYTNGYSTSQFGDWLAFYAAALPIVNISYKTYTTQLMIKMAAVIGRDDLVSKYEQRYDQTKAQYLQPPVLSGNGTHSGGGYVFSTGGTHTQSNPQYNYKDGDLMSYGSGNNGGTTKINAQTALAWALKCGLYRDEAHRDYLLSELKREIENENRSLRPNSPENSLGVGFLGVNVLTPVLSDFGASDTAYDLLMQEGVPSWIGLVLNGATTFWERWDSYTTANGFGSAGMNSFNHFSYGCVNEWMYEYMLGMQKVETSPAFKEFVLQPTLDEEGRIETAEGHFDSLYGRIESAWESGEGELMSYSCTVPANTTATLYLPYIFATEAAFNSANGGGIEGVEYVGTTTRNGIAVTEFNLVSGSFAFSVPTDTYSIYLTNTTPEFAAKISVDGGAPINLPRRVKVVMGEEITLKIIPADTEEHAFAAWVEGVVSTSDEITLKPTGNINLSFNLKAIYDYATLNFARTGVQSNADILLSVNGGEPQALPGSIRVRIGQPYTLEVSAVDPAEYSFLNWSGDIESNSGRISFIPTGNMNLSANFKGLIDYGYITFARAGIPGANAYGQDVLLSINGAAPTLLTNDVTHRLRADTEYTVTVSARNDVDYRFAGWTGGLTSADNTITFTPDKDMTLTANFEWSGYDSISYASAGASVVASGQANSSNWKTANIIDGNILPNYPTSNSLGWSSTNLGSAAPTGRHWFSINMGAQKTFDRFHIYPRMDTFTSAGGTCYFATEFTLEYSTSDTNATTAAQLDELEWITVPGGTGSDGRFVVDASDIPYKEPYVLQLDESIAARYVRMTVHRVNALASDTTSIWYWQVLSFGIYDTREAPEVSVTTPTLVETLSANLNISVEDDFGKTLKAYLKVGEELLYETSLTNGKGIMRIGKAPAAGVYDLVVKGDGLADGICSINIVPYNTNIWEANAYVLDGKLLVKFNDDVSLKSEAGCAAIGGANYNAKVLEDKRTIEVDVVAPASGTVVSVKGVKYPVLFPSYSFTFRVTVS